MELSGALGTMEIEMRKVYEIGGLPHFHAVEEDVSNNPADRQFVFFLLLFFLLWTSL